MSGILSNDGSQAAASSAVVSVEPARKAGCQPAVRRAGVRHRPRRPRPPPSQVTGVHAVCVFDAVWRLELLASNATARARLTALARAGREVLIALAPEPLSLAAPPSRLWLFHAAADSTWLVFAAKPAREGFLVELAVTPEHAAALRREAGEVFSTHRRGNTVEFPPAESMEAAVVGSATDAAAE